MADTLLSPTVNVTEATMVLNVLRELRDLAYTDTHSNVYTNGGTSLTVATDATTRWENGDYFDWVYDGTYDIGYLTAAPTATNLTMANAQLGSTGAGHSAGAVIRKLPRFWGVDAQKAVQASLYEDLYPRVFAIYENDTTLALTTQMWYPISVLCQDILFAYQKTTSTPTDIVEADILDLRWVDATLSNTNKAFKIMKAPVLDAATLYTQYTVSPAYGDLSQGMQRVVEYGACKRLLEWEAGGESNSLRNQQEPQSSTRTAAWFAQRQEELLAAEEALITRQFPRRRRNYIPPKPHIVI